MAIDLTRYTPARVAQGTGTQARLRFDLDHARAQDAVWTALDPSSLPYPHTVLRSQAPDRATYLTRPDLGRLLSTPILQPQHCDLALIVADGLSATAVHQHSGPLLTALLPKLPGWTLSPTYVVLQGRVAIADQIGAQLPAVLSLILIGERPGLTSPNSLGAYLTFHPRPGRTDAERNCVSNIRPEGLPYEAAATLIAHLLHASLDRQISGVTLKHDDASPAAIPPRPDSGSSRNTR